MNLKAGGQGERPSGQDLGKCRQGYPSGPRHAKHPRPRSVSEQKQHAKRRRMRKQVGKAKGRSTQTRVSADQVSLKPGSRQTPSTKRRVLTKPNAKRKSAGGEARRDQTGGSPESWAGQRFCREAPGKTVTGCPNKSPRRDRGPPAKRALQRKEILENKDRPRLQRRPPAPAKFQPVFARPR